MANQKSKALEPLVLLHGEESYLINRELARIEKNAIEPGFEDFNKFVFYGLDAKANDIIDQATTHPMMGNSQLILLKNADQFKGWDELVSYAKNPSSFTIFVVVHPGKKLDGRFGFTKAITAAEKKGKAKVFYAKKLFDDKIPGWISEEVRSMGYTIDQKAAALLAEYMGNNLEGIVKELEKLFLNLEEGEKEITTKLVDKYVGISRKYSVFELQKAFSVGNRSGAAKIASIMSQDPKTNPIFMLIGALNNHFSRIYKMHSLKTNNEKEVARFLKLGHSFFSKEYITARRHFSKSNCEAVFGLLYQYDLKSKGINASAESEGDLLRSLVADILDLMNGQ